jgi:hypothetical protein
VGAGNCANIFICTNRKNAAGRLFVLKEDQTCGNYRIKPVLRGLEIRQSTDTDRRIIALSKGQFAIVDAADFYWLSRFKWHCAITNNSAYAHHCFGGKNMSMHRVIMKPGPDLVVDHIDGNGLNNTRGNLRICTKKQNIYNRKGRGKTSQYKGICRQKQSKKWYAQIKYNGKQIHLGCFEREIDAAKAYDEKALQLFGEFAYLNFPNEKTTLCHEVAPAAMMRQHGEKALRILATDCTRLRQDYGEAGRLPSTPSILLPTSP